MVNRVQCRLRQLTVFIVLLAALLVLGQEATVATAHELRSLGPHWDKSHSPSGGTRCVRGVSLREHGPGNPEFGAGRWTGRVLFLDQYCVDGINRPPNYLAQKVQLFRFNGGPAFELCYTSGNGNYQYNMVTDVHFKVVVQSYASGTAPCGTFTYTMQSYPYAYFNGWDGPVAYNANEHKYPS